MFAGYIALCTGYIRFDTFHSRIHSVVHGIHAGYIALCTGYIVFDTFHIAGYIALCTGYIVFDTFHIAGYIALCTGYIEIENDAVYIYKLIVDLHTSSDSEKRRKLSKVKSREKPISSISSQRRNDLSSKINAALLRFMKNFQPPIQAQHAQPNINSHFSSFLKNEFSPTPQIIPKNCTSNQRFNNTPRPSIEQKFSGTEEKFKPHFDKNVNRPNGGKFCTHCKLTNHYVGNCYRLIGFPPNFKFTKSQKQNPNNNTGPSVPRNNNNMQASGFSVMEGTGAGNMFPHGAYSDLYKLLQEVKLGQQSEHNSNAIASANCAGAVHNSYFQDSSIPSSSDHTSYDHSSSISLSPSSPLHPPASIPSSLSPPRRSSRESHLPSYLNDYICNAVFHTDLTSSCFTAPLTPDMLPHFSLSKSNQSLLDSRRKLSKVKSREKPISSISSQRRNDLSSKINAALLRFMKNFQPPIQAQHAQISISIHISASFLKNEFK
ncbi:hypothetical protein H5410_038213 [Solanum commersonii]|uniref:Uncharacterized protein n=1 Tax=Solanum commersonii TaxID=4109 RepID=A0A9J5YA43_SOLCO|nr:hypothetical protein H5410_038213 [Solanum commersonii]